MRARILPVCLAASLLLSGCASLLNRQYVEVTAHNAAPMAEGDLSTLRAESYQELVNALLYLVTSGAEEGTIRLYLKSEDVAQNLEDACLEVDQEDPLGAYAVDNIRYSVSPLVTYQEVKVEITYRRSREQVASITSATGATAIRNALEKALQEFSGELAIRISYFDRDEAYIRWLCREAFCANPETSVDMPELTVSIYPDSGRQRIVEVLLAYHQEREELESRVERLGNRARDLEENRRLAEYAGDEQLLEIARTVLAQGGWKPQGGSTAYHALMERGADSQGLALAVALLCQDLELPCQVAIGTQNGELHCWNVVQTESGWMHLDLTRSLDQETIFLSDAQMTETGCVWNTDTLPRCGMPAEGEGETGTEPDETGQTGTEEPEAGGEPAIQPPGEPEGGGETAAQVPGEAAEGGEPPAQTPGAPAEGA